MTIEAIGEIAPGSAEWAAVDKELAAAAAAAAAAKAAAAKDAAKAAPAAVPGKRAAAGA